MKLFRQLKGSLISIELSFQPPTLTPLLLGLLSSSLSSCCLFQSLLILLVLLYLVVQGKSTTSVPTSLVGTKRKAAAITELKEWTCALCHVHATSEQGLNEHFRGKKHRAKEEELKGSKGAVKNQPVPVPKKVIDQPKIMKKITNNVPNQNLKQTRKSLVVSRPEDQPVVKNQVGAAKKGKFTFVCKQCKIKCNSEPTMVAHLSGKKHLTRMQELEATGKGISMPKVTSLKFTRKGHRAAGGPGKEMKFEGESRTIKEEQDAEETGEFRAPGAMVDEEAEVAEALMDEEEQAMEEQMDDDAEPTDELPEEGPFFHLKIKGEQN